MRKTKMINLELLTQAVNASNQLNNTLNNLVPLIASKLEGQFIGLTTKRASVKIDDEIKALLDDFVPTGVRCVVLYKCVGVYIRVGTSVSKPGPDGTDLSHRISTDHLLCNIDPNSRIASVQNLPVFRPYPTTFAQSVLTEFETLADAEGELDNLTSFVGTKKRRVRHFISEKSSY